jgi:hypothetical protein
MPTLNPVHLFGRVLEVVDDVLCSVVQSQKRTSKDAESVNEIFKKAIEELNAYEKKYHSEEIVAKKMAEAEAKDKLSLTTLSRLKEKFRVREELALYPCRDTNADSQPLKEEPTTTVEFHIHKSFPDKRPTIVKRELTLSRSPMVSDFKPEVLSKNSRLEDVLWNFSHFRGEKRLTLKQNPHFYEMLPTLPDEYEGTFRRDPIKTFDHEKICVLTDKSGLTGRVFLETAKETRAFGNVWVPKHAIIFKGSCLSLIPFLAL